MKDNEIKNVNVERYSIDSFYCRKDSVKGGVLIMSKEIVQWKKVIINDYDYLSQDRLFEFCITKFICDKFNVTVVGVYRSPSSNVKEFLSKLNILVTKLLKKSVNLIIAGDINIDVLQDSLEVRDLRKVLISHGMHEMVNFPTRYCTSTATGIDNFLTNMSKSGLVVEGIVTHLSDHDGQLLHINNNTFSPKTIRNVTVFKRKFTDENKTSFLKMLENESWMDIYMASVETKFDVFHSKFNYYFDMSFPKVKSRKFTNKTKWITPELIKKKNKITECTMNYRVTKNPDLKVLINNLNNDYKNSVMKAKQNYYSNKVNNSSNVNKVTWNIINDESRNVKQEQINNISLNKNGRLTESPIQVAKIFQDHFTNMVTNYIIPNLNFDSHTPLLKSDVIFNILTKFRTKSVSCHYVGKVLNSFENKYSTGFDDVPMPIIKYAKEYLIEPLTHLINSSFISGIFPTKLKISKIKPLFKNGDPHDVTNYRPLSLLSSFSKIFERIMTNQVIDFFETNNIMDLEQYGYVKGRSAIGANIDFIESIVDSVDKGEKVIGIFMDLSKAFDSVCHKQLLNSISDLGIRDHALTWFQSYLTNRIQYVELPHLNCHNQLNNVQSHLSTVTYGVPQGSILGPLLFLCYIKGLPAKSNFDKLILYADDINLKISGKCFSDIERVAADQLSTIQNYLTDKNLLLNPSKTKYISFCTKQRKIQSSTSNIKLNGKVIEEVEASKFLGLLVDKNLDWTLHVETMCNKIASGLYALRRMSFIINNISTLKTIYFSFIHSHISFGIALYGSTSIDNLNRVLVLQKRAIRIMLNLDWHESAREHFASLGIFTVYSLYIFEIILCVKKNLHNLTSVGHNHSYNTRGCNKIATESHKLKFFNKKPNHIGIKYYNLLPEEIKTIDDFWIFKKKLKPFMIQKAMYSLDDFIT